MTPTTDPAPSATTLDGELLLGVQDLHVCYGPISALRGVSVEIHHGEIVALIGANGAGKTTLLRAISGLLRPTAGQIFWAAPDPAGTPNPTPHPPTSPPPHLPPPLPLRHIDRLRPDQIVRLGLAHVPEGRQIFPLLSVRENLRLGAYQRDDDLRPDLDRCHHLFPILKQRRNQRAGTLSGGEQQMLAIARALMARPRLLLLDEPSLGLAPLIVRKIFDIIKEINRDGTTVFLVEQNAHMALKTAHRAYVLQTGTITLADRAAALLENPDVKRAYLGG